MKAEPVGFRDDVTGARLDEGQIERARGRTVAWRIWGSAAGRPVLRIQGAAGCRFAPPSLALWSRARLKGLAVDRPGFGRSTRLPGRGLRVVADDLAAVLDHLGIDALPVVAHSAGGPHGLAFAAAHPDRVHSLSIVSGGCPLNDDERRSAVQANAVLGELFDRGWAALHKYLVGLRADILESGTSSVVPDAASSDQQLLAERARDESARAYSREALRQGAAGWADEAMALLGPWDVDVTSIRVPVRWWHGAHDRMVPVSAVRRLAATLPTCELTVLEDRGHYLPAMPILSQLAAAEAG